MLKDATDSKWQPNVLYSRVIEGYGVGKINNDGYVNTYDYYPNMPIDILIMGSSQVEGFQVNIKNTMSSVLNEKEVGNVYNIGISAHYFLTSVKNLEKAIKKYNPKYVVIEILDLNYDEEELKMAINDSTPAIKSESTGILGVIRKNPIFKTLYNYNPFFKLVFKRIQDFKSISKQTTNTKKKEFNVELTNELLNKMKTIATKSETKIIIFYHPNTTSLNKEGKLILPNEKEEIKMFSKLCENNDIYFLDMSDRIREEYEKNYILPYGFSNTSVGNGHFNKYGHEMVADELYKLIKEEE